MLQVRQLIRNIIQLVLVSSAKLIPEIVHKYPGSVWTILRKDLESEPYERDQCFGFDISLMLLQPI